MAEFPKRILAPLEINNGSRIALIKLNTPLDSHIECFRTLWSKAVLKAVVDGAVNDLHAYVTKTGADEFMPDMVTGDFDSAQPALLEHYRHCGVEIINTPDQDETDFTKCLRIVGERISQKNLQVSCIVVFVSFGGRVDHILGNMNTLYRAPELTSLPVYIISGDSLVYLLSPGLHVLQVSTGLEEGTCGLIPLGQPARHVSTKGLKWNINDQVLEFGGLVSTSNHIVEETVSVETDSHLLWTMSIKEMKSS